MLVSVNGVVQPAEQATIPVTDEGLLRGDGVFEVARVYPGGRVYALDEHLERMAGSAQRLMLEFNPAAMADDARALLEQTGDAEGYLRLVATRGGTRLLLLEPVREAPATIALVTVHYSPSRVLDQIKSLSYAANMLVTRQAKEQGADEALLVTPHGRVLEGPRQAFVASLDGETLVTPPLSDHILDSITRRRLIDGGLVSERAISADELPFAQEAFLASTTHEAHPVHAIDGVQLPAAPGPLTQRAGEHVRAQIEAAIGSPLTA